MENDLNPQEEAGAKVFRLALNSSAEHGDDADAALEAIKTAGSKGQMKRIAIQALGEVDE